MKEEDNLEEAVQKHSLGSVFEELKKIAPEENYRAATVRTILELLDILQTEHETGIVHKDISPDDIFIGRDNKPCFIDSALSKATYTSGTYWSPELFKGEEATPASDVWSVGAILYQLLEGEHPISSDFEKVSEILIDKEKYERAKRYMDFKKTPERIQCILEKAMSYDPSERYQTADEFKFHLKKAFFEVPDVVNYSDQGITDISRLELSPNIEGLILNNNQIKEFGGIEHLDRLKVIMIKSNPIDINALEQLLQYKKEGKLPCLCFIEVDGCNIDWLHPSAEKIIVGLRKYDVTIIGADKKIEEERLAAIHIEGYKVLMQIGEGGTFDVFLIQDKNNEYRALLLPKEKPVNPSSRRMLEIVGSDSLFDRELFILRNNLEGLNGIPKFYGEVEVTKNGKKIRGLLEEYIQSRSLYTNIKLRRIGHLGFNLIETELNAEIALNYIIKTLDILQDMHSRSVVHNDFSPNNIIVSKKGIYVIDYALSSSKGANFLIYSSRRYSSPEALRQEKDITPASDIWSVGVILYESIKDKHPISNDPDKVVEIVSDAERYEMAKDNIDFENVHPVIQAIIRKCMSYDPNSRYRTTAELKADLQEALPVIKYENAKEIVEEYYKRMNIEVVAPVLRVSEDFCKEYFEIMKPHFKDQEFLQDLIYSVAHPDQLNRAVIKLALGRYFGKR
jgi:serine/threonine protein kinase